jgi:transcriptional regulator with XRE-family HTH domain
MPLVELLRNLRAAKKAKLEDVANAINISREDYFKIEKGQLAPNSSDLEAIASFYDICPSVFNQYAK